MTIDYKIIPYNGDYGIGFCATVYSGMVRILIEEIEQWCIDNIKNKLFEIIETMLGCIVIIHDDIYAMAFKLRWL